MNTPWKISTVESRYTLAYVENADGEHVANCNSPDLVDSVCESNAALIVRAVNSHQALLDALEPFADIGADLTNAMCHKGMCSAEKCFRCRKVFAARAALKLARGES